MNLRSRPIPRLAAIACTWWVASVGLSAQAPTTTPAGTLQLVMLVDVQPDKIASVSAAFEDYLAASRHDSNVLSVALVQQIDRPNHFILLERFSSMQTYTRHVDSSYVVSFREHLHPYLGSPVNELLSRQYSPTPK